MLDILKTCIPIIVGALIAIVPTAVEKNIERKNDKAEKRHQEKRQMYVELISLFGKVLKNRCRDTEIDLLRDRINLVSITGSVEVVEALNRYIDTWGKATEEEQNERYCELLKVIRTDLEIDKKINDNFPKIGLRDINVKS